MKKQTLDIKQVTLYYRILGLPFTASKEAIRQSRNKLMMRFHPDRNTKGWVVDELSLEDRVHVVQEAYLFLTENYEQITKEFNFLESSPLSTRANSQIRSHWVYSEIAKLSK